MSSRSNTWPTIYERTYPSGRKKYVVDLGVQNGSRARKYLNTRGEAEAVAQQARAARAEQGAMAFFLPCDVQAQAIKLYQFLQPNGISFDDVHRHYDEVVFPFLMAPKVAEAADKLIAHVESEGCRPSWSRALRGFLNEFTRRFGERKLTDITKSELEDFCFQPGRQPRLEPKTKRNRRAMASELYNFAIENDWADKNLASRLPAPRSADRTPGILKVEEIQRLLQVADDFGFLGYAVLSLFGGIRPEEIQKLDWSYVHVADGLIEITEQVSKIHRAREVTINETMAAWLPSCRRESGPIVDRSNFYERLASWRKEAQIKVWPSDVLRHCFASYHVAMFKTPYETARQMGHIDGLQTLYKHYVAFVPETVAKRFWALGPAAVPTATTAVAA